MIELQARLKCAAEVVADRVHGDACGHCSPEFSTRSTAVSQPLKKIRHKKTRQKNPDSLTLVGYHQKRRLDLR
jgi:hypothetical protein